MALVPGPLSLRVEGLDRLVAKLARRSERLVNAVEAGLFVEGELTMTKAKALTPVDEGTLRASGHVSLPEVKDGAVTVELGFGGPAGSGNQGGKTNPKDVGYAVIVHEDLTAHHAVGQAKYLEVPVDRRRRGFAERLAARVRRRLGVV